MRTQWSDFGAFIFSPKKLPFCPIRPAQSHVAVAQTQWTFKLATQSRKVLTWVHYLPRTLENFSRNLEKRSHCTSLLATWCRELFTTLYYLPRSLENFPLHFITCHAVFLFIMNASSAPPGPKSPTAFFFYWRNFKIQNWTGFWSFSIARSKKAQKKKK